MWEMQILHAMLILSSFFLFNINIASYLNITNVPNLLLN